MVKARCIRSKSARSWSRVGTDICFKLLLVDLLAEVERESSGLHDSIREVRP